MSWAAGCCLALALADAAPAAERLPSGSYIHDPVAIGRWSLRRVTSDEAGRFVLSCEATWTREADLYLYLSLDAATQSLALGIPATRPPSGAAMRASFDGDQAGAIEGPATFASWSGDDAGEDGYLLLPGTGDGAKAAERLARSKAVTLAYPFEGRTRTETFRYGSAAKVLTALSDCASGR